MRGVVVIVAALGIVLAVGPAESAEDSDLRREVEWLKNRVEELERTRDTGALDAEHRAKKGQPAAPVDPFDAPLTHDVLKDGEDTDADTDEKDEIDSENSRTPDTWSTRLNIPKVSLGGFWDAGYEVRFRDEDQNSLKTKNFFRTGPLDIFLTSQLTDKVFFLTEAIIEFENQGENIVDVERVLLKYDHADWLAASIGRGHTPIGYWNTHFHHGAFFHNSIDRPLIFRFEDDGGFLPMHIVGIQASGRLDTDLGLLGYTLNVGNGRGENPKAVQLTDDLNDSKLFSLQLTIDSFANFNDLLIGANVLSDKIPKRRNQFANEIMVDDHASISELITTAFVVYKRRRLDLLIEGVWMRHDSNGKAWSTYGGYIEVDYHLGRWTPYARVDWQKIDGADPFYDVLPEVESERIYTAGLRWDWLLFAALKLEYRFEDANTYTAHRIASQIAIGF